MTQPTHFIEVWKYEGLLMRDLKPKPIELLDYMRNITKISGGTTIAVWKIYPKKINKQLCIHYTNY